MTKTAPLRKISDTTTQGGAGALPRGLERLTDNENAAKANYAEADRLAAFHKVPRAPEFLPRASFETDPEILAAKPSQAKLAYRSSGQPVSWGDTTNNRRANELLSHGSNLH